MSSETILVIHETSLKATLRDASTFITTAAIIGLGWALDSSAMQWLGAVVAFLIMLNRARGVATRTDVAGARRLLDDIERKGAA
jgi:hypothetical protein